MAGRIVAFNERGRPVGEGHPNAKLEDADIDLIFALREEGLTLSAIAAKFEVGKSCVWKVLKGMRRADTPAEWRRAGTPQPSRGREGKPALPTEDSPGALLQRYLAEAWR